MASRTMTTFEKIQANIPISDPDLLKEHRRATREYHFYANATADPFWSEKKSRKIYSDFMIVSHAMQSRIFAQRLGIPDPTANQTSPPQPAAAPAPPRWRPHNRAKAWDTRLTPTLEKIKRNMLEHVSDKDLFKALALASRIRGYYQNANDALEFNPETLQGQYPGATVAKVEKIKWETQLVHDACMLRFVGLEWVAFAEQDDEESDEESDEVDDKLDDELDVDQDDDQDSELADDDNNNDAA